jgi:hypothetical protein
LSVLSPHGLGQFLTEHRQTVLVVLSVIELLILVAVFARWYDRRYGLRRTARRIRRAVADAWRDLIAPIVRAARFRRGVKVIAARLSEPDPGAEVRDALGAARSIAGGRADIWPFGLRFGARTVTVALAGPDPAPEPEAGVWRPAGDRLWTATRPVRHDPQLAAGGHPRFLFSSESEDRGGRKSPPVDNQPLPVVLGVAADELVMLDLARSPGIVSVHGATVPAAQLVAALAAQLAAGLFGAPDTLLLHDAVLDSPVARPFHELVAVLEQRPAGRHPRTVLICARRSERRDAGQNERPGGRPGEADMGRLAELAARDPGLLVLVAGYVPGSRWRLRVTSQGRVLAPELGIDADAAPLWKGLERVLATRPAMAATAAPSRPIWADEEPEPQPEAPPEATEPLDVDDLIEPAHADAASSRSSGDR